MLSKEEVAELETKHGRIAHVVGKEGKWECVFRKPTRAEYKRFRTMAHNPTTAPDAQDFLSRACVVFPSREAFDVLLEDYCAIPEVVSGQLGALAGFAVDESVKE